MKMQQYDVNNNNETIPLDERSILNVEGKKPKPWLPSEMYGLIISFASYKMGYVLKLRSVSREWEQLVRENTVGLQILNRLPPLHVPLTYFPNIKSFEYINCNDRADEKVISAYLSTIPTLKHLESLTIRKNIISHSKKIMDFIIDCQFIRFLDLATSYFDVCDIARLAESTVVERLEYLNLTNGCLGSKGSRILAQHCHKFTHLKTLDLTGALLRSSSGAHIAQVMMTCKELRELHLSFNRIGDSGVPAIVNALPLCTKLEVFSFQKNGNSKQIIELVAEGVRQKQIANRKFRFV